MNPGSPLLRRVAVVLAAAAFAVLALGVTACGDDEETNVKEGEPVELGNVRFNVQLTRFLNPNDVEDAEYLEGQEPIADGQAFLGVFIEADNESDDDVTLPDTGDFEILDTTGVKYHPLDDETVFGFPFGTTIGGKEEIPETGTAAASGPINGAIMIFRVDESVSENRPLELEIHSGGNDGTIELDI